MIFTRDQKIVFIGDSITDYGRKRPVGEGRPDGLGHSYVALIDALLRTGYPELRLRVVNMGNGGDRVRELRARWQTDVLDLAPDWVVTHIGVNDVWRQFDSPLQTEEHGLITAYETDLERLITDTTGRVTGMILMTPFYMEGNPEEPMRAMMDRYGAVVKRLGERHGCPVVDLQPPFNEFLRHYSAQSMSWDRVHPDMVGHAIIARAFLERVGFAWNGAGGADPAGRPG